MKRKTLGQVLDAFGAVDDEHRSHGWRAVCPIHNDEASDKPSLILDYNAEEKRVLVMCEGQRPECSFEAIVAAVRLTPGDLRNPTYAGHTTRHIREKARKPAAPLSARQSADGDAFVAALWLEQEIDERPDGDVARRLRDEYGLTDLDSGRAFDLGVGIDRDPAGEDYAPEEAWLTMTARTADGAVAYVQKRDPDPAAKVRWLSGRNPGRGTVDETRWDGVGLIGKRHRDAPVIITEGPSDGLAVAALDAYDVVTFRGAWAASEIMQVREALTGRDVVVFPDKDGAGDGAAHKIVDRVASVADSLRIATVPEYAEKDVRDIFKHDPATFAQRFADLVNEAVAYDPAQGVELDVTPYLKGTDHDRATATVAWVRAGGKDIAYTPGHGFLYFDGTVWLPGSDAVVMHAQATLGLHVRGQANALRSEEAALAGQGEYRPSSRVKALETLSRRLLDAAPRRSVLAVLESDPSVRRESGAFDSAKDVLAVGNGVVNLRTGKLRPMTSKDLLTRRISVDYRPDAEAPQWEAFLRDVLVDRDGNTDSDLVDYFQELIGYGITGEANRPARYYLFVGSGSNGKSVATSVLGDVFSAYTKRTAFATFSGRDGESSAGVLAARAGLAGARLVFTSESGRGERFAAAFLKDFTGGDPVEAKVMRGNPFVYHPQGLVITATNHRPDVDSIDNGIWRRLRLVYWHKKIAAEDMDLGLADRLLDEEAEGILAWAVRGAVRYYRKGSAALVDEPEQVREATRAYREESDDLHEFLEVNVIRTADHHDRIPAPAFWQRYQEWSQWNGTKPMGKKFFYKALDERIGMRTSRRGGWPQSWTTAILRPAAEVRDEFAALLAAGSLDDTDVERMKARLAVTDHETVAKLDGQQGHRTKLTAPPFGK